jgi:hypothetical protein
MTSGVEACTVRHEQGMKKSAARMAAGPSGRTRRIFKVPVGRRTRRPIHTRAMESRSGGSIEVTKFGPSALSWPRTLVENEVPKRVASRFKYTAYWRWK